MFLAIFIPCLVALLTISNSTFEALLSGIIYVEALSRTLPTSKYLGELYKKKNITSESFS
jgi:hypothetical protein